MSDMACRVLAAGCLSALAAVACPCPAAPPQVGLAACHAEGTTDHDHREHDGGEHQPAMERTESVDSEHESHDVPFGLRLVRLTRGQSARSAPRLTKDRVPPPLSGPSSVHRTHGSA